MLESLEKRVKAAKAALTAATAALKKEQRIAEVRGQEGGRVTLCIDGCFLLLSWVVLQPILKCRVRVFALHSILPLCCPFSGICALFVVGSVALLSRNLRYCLPTFSSVFPSLRSLVRHDKQPRLVAARLRQSLLYILASPNPAECPREVSHQAVAERVTPERAIHPRARPTSIFLFLFMHVCLFLFVLAHVFVPQVLQMELAQLNEAGSSQAEQRTAAEQGVSAAKEKVGGLEDAVREKQTLYEEADGERRLH